MVDLSDTMKIFKIFKVADLSPYHPSKEPLYLEAAVNSGMSSFLRRGELMQKIKQRIELMQEIRQRIKSTDLGNFQLGDSFLNSIASILGGRI